MRHKGRQLRSVLTVNGRIGLRRIRWSGAGEVRAPLDALLDTAEKTFTRGVREMLCRLNQCSSSFVKTAQNLRRLAALSISGETARKIVLEAGGRVVAQMRQGRLDYGWTAAECVVQGTATTRVYTGCDGVKVPVVTDAEKRKRRATIKAQRQRCGKRRRPLPALKPGADQKFKEARVVIAHDEAQTRRAVAVTRGDCEATGRLLRALHVRLKTQQADETIANIDGAPWIRNQLELHGVVRAINLDYYHLKDYAQRTRREAYGEGTAEGQAWLQQFLTAILEQGVAAALDFLHQWRRDLPARRRNVADGLIGYVSERRQIIRYQEFRKNEWQIGSGPTEAECKTTTQRVKGRGRRWDWPNAEAVMALAALDDSDCWQTWWAQAA
jgi:hypothetical protein